MIRGLTLSIAALLLLTGCPEGGVIRENEQVNRWIHSVMDENYLWSGQMPEDWEQRLETHPETFFKRLLYVVEGDIDLSDQYSGIAYTGDENHFPAYEEDTEYGVEAVTYHFGMEFRYAEATGISFFQIILVSPGSPADLAGLKRGDCFHTVNGSRLNDDRELETVLQSETTITVEIIYPEEKTVTLRKAYHAEKPVQYHTVFDLAPITGYLVYNHFTDGSGNSYYNELRGIFSGFLQAGVENIIVDLRCNGGGELTAARRMCSLLAPPADLGNTYLYKERNTSFGEPDLFESESLYTASQMNGYNCGDISLYFIAGIKTASASELVIHCLRPLYERAGLKFMQFGGTTDGKNVGGQSFSNIRYEWEFYAITLRAHNIDKVSGYEYGLEPDRKIEELDKDNPVLTDSGDYVFPIGDWGDVEGDRILRGVLDEIYGYGGWLPLLPVEDDPETRAVPSRETVPVGEVKETLSIKPRMLTERRIVTDR